MSNIEPLARAWLDAKRAEAKANAERLAIEEQLIGAVEVPIEGSKTQKFDSYKITVTQPVTRKLDVERWDDVADKCPDDMKPVRLKLEADPAGMKWLMENKPAIWKKIAVAFETKPGKVGFKVEEI